MLLVLALRPIALTIISTLFVSSDRCSTHLCCPAVSPPPGLCEPPWTVLVGSCPRIHQPVRPSVRPPPGAAPSASFTWLPRPAPPRPHRLHGPHSVCVPILTVSPLSGSPWACVSASPRHLFTQPCRAQVATETFMQTRFLPYRDADQARQGKDRLGRVYPPLLWKHQDLRIKQQYVKTWGSSHQARGRDQRV